MNRDNSMPPFFSEEPLLPTEREIGVPVTALCLKVPGSKNGDLVVHRERGEDYVFLFEALDDAAEYARAAEMALGFAPEIGRVRLSELNFRSARYKPALYEQHFDITINPRRAPRK
jgi:hypothetical protein